MNKKSLQNLKATSLKLSSLILFGLIVSVVPLQAAFEQIGAGARALGMGNAFSAMADDATAIHYNAAGLAQLRLGEVTAGYGKLYSGLKDDSAIGHGFVGAAQPLAKGRYGTLGAGWLSFSLSGAYREDTLSLSYGKESFIDGLMLGGSAKILKRTFGSDPYTQADPLFQRYGQDTSNYAFDFGVLYRPSASYSFALSAKDINQPDIALAGGEKLPLEIRTGFGYHQRHFAFDAEVSKKDKDVNVSMGLEKTLASVIALRAGVTVGSRNKREIGTGMGYRGRHFGLDYAFVFPLAGVESTAGSHRFSLTVRFGKAPERARWEFEKEESSEANELLEQKSAQINALEKELDELKELNESGRVESNWTRQRIEQLEKKVRGQENKDVEAMKSRMVESKLEAQKLKRQMELLEERLRKLSEEQKRRPSAPRAAEQVKPAAEKGIPADRGAAEAGSTGPQTPGTGAATSEKLPAALVPESAPASGSMGSAPRTYTVQDGDTLQSISYKLFNDPARWVEIYELNADRIERGGTVRTGQTLLLPSK